MGQAKQRGTFEQRKAEAIKRKRIVKSVRGFGKTGMALAIAASLAGAVHWWPK